MHAPELTLAAAIRDSEASRLQARSKAVRNLAPALLAELDRPGPSWRAADDHARGAEVVAALHRALEDTDDPMIPGLAAVGLGLLGEPDVIDRTAKWLDDASEETEAVFRRECAVIAASFVGAAAPDDESGRPIRERIRDALAQALRAEAPDVRFQAGIALVEVVGHEAEPAIVEALAREEHPEVIENLVAALSRLDPPSDAALDALAEIVADDPDGSDPAAFEAALTLSAARRTEGGARLVAALDRRIQRDRALEALAVLGRSAPPEALQRVDRLARAFWTPGITRVRAAYALARMLAPATADRPNPGVALLRRLAWHPRPAVREAVDDAYSALRKLAE